MAACGWRFPTTVLLFPTASTSSARHRSVCSWWPPFPTSSTRSWKCAVGPRRRSNSPLPWKSPRMRSPELPQDEAERGRVLAEHGILDTPPEATFDALLELAAQLLDAPIALVSLVDRERQWFKAKLGLDARQMA